jgi:hypothetical protein
VADAVATQYTFAPIIAAVRRVARTVLGAAEEVVPARLWGFILGHWP